MPRSAGTTVDGGRPAASGRGTSPLDRVTVNLTARASRSLDRAVELTGDSKTDSINRALSLYAYIEQVLSDGGSVFVQETQDGPQQKLVIF
ncbi:hypothetical protein GCM10010425_68270 [Streptomyces spororaveus]|jgi:hypothetical protein|uniref:Uncharacterized protein n=1 Tax=Streptomyces spororaveus TaxID=284039 RepID=A0ABQ3T352_9ACTN|nr:hypothetical protein Sspor_03820 [Streptomyces spororaveus]